MKLLLQVLLVISLALSHASGEPTCPTLEGVTLSREVFKEGYHRDLTTSLHGNITRSGLEIRLILVETFPPGFYIDQYELANLKSFGGPETQILEAVDVEKPAHLSTEFNFFIFIESTDAADDQFVASVSLPIHLRYHSLR
ncbi:putative phosphatidylinositol-glycan biosynthesis class X protein-like [Apostichopus japonicus]|uniref:Phosphatidylinositol-glycan biosynthesis class X protein n=1 Tax=Stichopus japonicus TaxID=307972 RepID=A0A2G8LEC3_STIJA|nr:putative phosphatidylinositol-glycan biosynthesis class X protein-like [Apostichopus japonicus]